MEYYTTQEATTWNRSNSSCELAAPELNINNDGNYTIHVNGTNSSEPVWIGYSKIQQAFEYKGILLFNAYCNTF